MTAIQMNAEILRNLGTLAEDESMLKRVAKYLRKLVAEKESDSTEMSREEYFQKLDRSLEQARQGEVYRMLPGESLDDFLNRVG